MAKDRFATLSHASFSLPIPVKEFMRVYLAQKNVNVNQMMFAIISALITGDLVLGKLEYGSLRQEYNMFTTMDDLNIVKLFDSNGNHLNPSKIVDCHPELNAINI
jgi:hypothetical protein